MITDVFSPASSLAHLTRPDIDASGPSAMISFLENGHQSVSPPPRRFRV